MINQALLALRDLLVPSTDISGEVVGTDSGNYSVRTKNGIRSFPAIPGLVPAIGKRVVVQNGTIVQVVGAQRPVPTYYV